MGFLEALLKCCPEAILAVNENGIITIVNQEACRLLQRDMKDIIGKSITIAYEDLAAAKATNREMYNNGGIIRDYQARVRTGKGKLIQVRISACHRLDTEGNYRGAIGVFEQYRPWLPVQSKKKFRLWFNR
jgi:PAS domain S-box-containing protein